MRLPEISIPPGQIDDYLKNYRYPCRFILQKGRYTTRGIWNFFPNFDGCMLPPGSELIGEGSSLTQLELFNTVNVVNNQTALYHTVLTAGNRTSGSKVLPANYCNISGLTIDCDSKLPTIGIQVWSSNVKMEDVVVKNTQGDFPSRMEGFGILINNPGNEDEHDGGHILRDCKVYSKPNSYVTGIYVGCLKRNVPLETSIVDNCKSLCYSSSSLSHCHAAFGINSNLIIDNCESYGYENVIFNDTGDTYNVQINNSVFRNIGYSFISLRANDTGFNRQNIKATNCFVEFSDTKQDHVAVLICDDQSLTKDKSTMKNIIVDNCNIENKSGKKLYYGSLNGKNFQNVGIKNSILPKLNLNVVIAGKSSGSMWVDNQNTLQ
jgi:hypothetical protein